MLQIAYSAGYDPKIVSQNTENFKENIKTDLSDLSSIFNLGNARLSDPDHFGQLALRQTEPFPALHDFVDELFFLA